jgi:hypothetical protein
LADIISDESLDIEEKSLAGRLGFHFKRYTYSGTANISTATVNNVDRMEVIPAWFVVLVTGILPAIWIVKWRRRPRWGPGCCAGCGYDLRATPVRCPECGRVVERPEGNKE